MNKKLLFLIVLSSFLYGITQYKTCNWDKEFYFSGGTLIQTDDSYHAEITVIINRHWHDSSLPERVLAEYIKMNGQFLTLKIEFYYSEWHSKFRNPYLTLFYDGRES